MCLYEYMYAFCLTYGANNAKVAGLAPVQDIHLRVGLVDPCGSLPPEYSLGIFWGSV